MRVYRILIKWSILRHVLKQLKVYQFEDKSFAYRSYIIIYIYVSVYEMYEASLF